MKLLTTTAILLALAGNALAQSEDWFNQQANAGASTSQMTEKQAMKEAIRYVGKTKLGKEYKAMEKAFVAGKLSASDPNFLATQIRYEAEVTRVAAGKMTTCHCSTGSGDNQSAGYSPSTPAEYSGRGFGAW